MWRTHAHTPTAGKHSAENLVQQTMVEAMLCTPASSRKQVTWRAVQEALLRYRQCCATHKTSGEDVLGGRQRKEPGSINGRGIAVHPYLPHSW